MQYAQEYLDHDIKVKKVLQILKMVTHSSVSECSAAIVLLIIYKQHLVKRFVNENNSTTNRMCTYRCLMCNPNFCVNIRAFVIWLVYHYNDLEY